MLCRTDVASILSAIKILQANHCSGKQREREREINTCSISIPSSACLICINHPQRSIMKLSIGFELKQQKSPCRFSVTNRQQFLPPQLFSRSCCISDIVPVGIIAGGTVGSCILLLMFLFAIAFFLYRQRKSSECTHLARMYNPCQLFIHRFVICNFDFSDLQHLHVFLNGHITSQSAI